MTQYKWSITIEPWYHAIKLLIGPFVTKVTTRLISGVVYGIESHNKDTVFYTRVEM